MIVVEPKILKAVDEKLDCLVEMVEQVIEETKVYGEQCPECKEWFPPGTKQCNKCLKKVREILEESQLHNLSNMANATDSVKALELFVRYQMGRHSGWRYNGFGDRVIGDFGELGEMAKDLSQEQAKAIQIHLIRLYLGFLTRAFIARRPRE